MSEPCPFCKGEAYFHNLPLNVCVKFNLNACPHEDTTIKEHFRYVCRACSGEGTQTAAAAAILSGEFEHFKYRYDKTGNPEIFSDSNGPIQVLPGLPRSS